MNSRDAAYISVADVDNNDGWGRQTTGGDGDGKWQGQVTSNDTLTRKCKADSNFYLVYLIFCYYLPN